MFYLIYKITNNINNKIYVGSHKTKNKDDGYMGSGKYLNYAINKYGIENFTKEILFVFDNAKEMYDKKAEIVDDNFLAEENTYNLKRGGFGGFDYINSTGNNVYGRNGQLGFGGENLKDGKYWKDRLIQEGKWEAYCDKISNSRKIGFSTGRLVPSFKDKKHTPDTLLKMSISHKGKGVGPTNSQYGTCWIYHSLVGNKKCHKDLLPLYIDQGWSKGKM